jgi:hypothetical protein
MIYFKASAGFGDTATNVNIAIEGASIGGALGRLITGHGVNSVAASSCSISPLGKNANAPD